MLSTNSLPLWIVTRDGVPPVVVVAAASEKSAKSAVSRRFGPQRKATVRRLEPTIPGVVLTCQMGDLER